MTMVLIFFWVLVIGLWAGASVDDGDEHGDEFP